MRVVIADDAVLIREGVAHLLTESGVEVVDQVGDADALLTSVRDLNPDVALIDIRMPPSHTDEGLRAAREIRSRYPETAVLVLSQHLEPAYALRLVEDRPEGVGYLMRNAWAVCNNSSTPCSESQPVNASSTEHLSMSCSPDAAGSIPSPSSRRVSGKSLP